MYQYLYTNSKVKNGIPKIVYQGIFNVIQKDIGKMQQIGAVYNHMLYINII